MSIERKQTPKKPPAAALTAFGQKGILPIMKQQAGTLVQRLPRRLTAFFLALVMLFGLLPVITPEAQAASWAQEYLDTLSDWNVMRGDIQGNLNPERNITRAEFVALVNRAYGYDELNGNPFTDVPESAWYAEDIDIAYNVGYFQGTTETTAVPAGSLTREQAAVLLSRNLMLQPTVGETLGFSDSRTLSEWSRGLIGAAVNEGVVNGYSDGTFRPKNQITRGEVAAMLARALGNLVQEPGDYTLGSIYGNVTINSSGVNLRNTVIVGNLYLTGGIGLGDVLLENVTVRGQIVVSGAGESQSSQSSVNLRNVVADSLIVDNISNQFVTVRAEGDTSITKTSVRTNSFVEDACPAGYGLHLIELDGEEGSRLQLAGNIKEVVNLTPGSALQMTQGSAQKVTVDEHATGSTVSIDAGARIEELNLDVGTSVSGSGDIGTLNVAASGCVVTMLPDNITIRPGITATVGGTVMDSATAAESSADPRLLAGYPTAKNAAPTSATLVFSTNKAGTVYWAVTALADGSVGEDNLINPPSYAGTILKSGNVKADKSKTEYTANITGLTKDGSYYITAVMVDARGNHSPLKVAAFSTPDDTVPAFTTGYPVMTKTTTTTSQVTVMTNKSCLLYYALLSKGSNAPTAQEMKAGALTGNWGYGTVDVVRNVTQPINVNSVPLEEQTDYDLYLWLTDYDGAKSSAVRKVTFKTPDETPPIVTDIMQTNSLAAAVEVTYALNEPGNLLWAIVAEGNDTFMTHELDTLEAKVKVESGVGALRKGSSSAARADTDIKLAISGLNTNSTHTTSYTLYYIAKDRAGNYGTKVETMNVRTLDTEAPTVTQEFTSFNGNDKTKNPMSDSDIRLVFSESIQGGSKGEKVFMKLYNDVETAVGEAAKAEARKKLADALKEHITMYTVSSSGNPTQVVDRNYNNEVITDPSKPDNWVIDYRYATVTMEEGKMIITFPTDKDNMGTSALNLGSGVTYYFRVENIYDNALTPNAMGNKNLDTFTTVYAQISLSNNDLGSIPKDNIDGGSSEDVRLDMCLNVTPISTSKVADTEHWDMILWSDTSVSLDVYRCEVVDNRPVGNWEKLGSQTITVADEKSGISLHGNVITTSGQTQFEKLQELKKGHVYQYGIHFTKVNNQTNPDSWSELVTMQFAIIAGGTNALSTVSGNVNNNYDSSIEQHLVTSIGTAYSPSGLTDILTLRRQFTDREVPSFAPTSPRFTAGSSVVNMELALNRDGTIYYVIAPTDTIMTTVETEEINTSNDGSSGTLPAGMTYIPTDGNDREKTDRKNLIAYTKGNPGFSSPDYLGIVNPRYNNSEIKTGRARYSGANLRIDVSGLKPDTQYYAYFVLQGGGEIYSAVNCYRFKTTEVQVPIVTVQSQSPNATMSTSEDSYLSYAVVEFNKLPSFITATFTHDKAYESSDQNVLPGDATVLDAMITSVKNEKGRTFFDKYASSNLKDQVMQYIRGDRQENTQQEPENRWKDVEIEHTKTEVGQFSTYMKTELEYVVLATARHVYGGIEGDSYGFKAIRALYLPDTKPPEYSGSTPILRATVQDIYTRDQAGNYTWVNPNDWAQTKSPRQYYYTGSVTIDFDKPVYQVVLQNGNRTRKEVWSVAKNTATGNAVSILDIVGGTAAAKLDIPPNSTSGVRQSFTLTFEKLYYNDTIVLFDTGSIANSNSITNNKRLTLRFDPSIKNADHSDTFLDYWDPGFQVTWN